MECKKQKNLEICPCTEPDCELKGTCCECLRYHLKNNELPACCFSASVEKTRDRSIKNFIKNYKKNV